ncbi:ABC transporter ATP-binding protein [Nocardioides sp. TF02-7]|uniref:ABC transporter ATP-binding protein n=1 Tax=Nocardioides sp. TF02-7 TaxID=2917724 RepID=UPI001F05211D|nr:ABC transporter ATP-binding protein [Nocardioides sp. TF02-7]UMG91258.1 ABC transporter ATP-binding protein [Nocardioides sp. TF02-7]
MSTQLLDQDGAPLTDAEHGVRVAGLRMVFRDQNRNEVVALQDVDLEVAAGEFCVLLGPSGCGKTTLLRCIAGLETPTDGSITIEGTPAVAEGRVLLEPQRRPVGMVFQSYALWPHLTVAQNVAYPLTTGPRRERPAKSEVRERVAAVLEAMRIPQLADRRIGQLSGGQQQRVALARAVAAGNRVVLFDEPLSNIDAKVREDLRVELKTMQKELGFTAIYVTHDQVEALDLADKVVVLDHGRIVQTGTPGEVYFRPSTRHVADFIGTSNLIAGVTRDVDDDRVSVDSALGMLDAPGDGVPGEPAVVVSRAHDWWIEPTDEAPRPGWEGVLTSLRLLGAYTEYVVSVGATELRIWDRHHRWAEAGMRVRVGTDLDAAWVVRDDG